MKRSMPHSAVRGFTLVEVVVTMGVIATLVSTFLVLMGLGTESLSDTINEREADRLTTALEREFSILRPDEAIAEVTTAFDKAYDWIDKSSRGDAMILLYTYWGDLTMIRDGGFPEAETPAAGVLIPAVRLIVGGKLAQEIRSEIEAVSGPVFLVKTTQLVYENEQLVAGKPGIEPPYPNQDPLPGGVTPGDSYPQAVIAIEAEFYRMPTNDPEYIEKLTAHALRDPLFSRRMGVRR